MCFDTKIQEILPAYLENSLEPASRTRIEQHLAVCSDCREELALLSELANDPVPAQDEAFWAEMPDRIYREVQAAKQKENKKFALSDFLGWIFPPYRQWVPATATAIVLAMALWLMVRSSPMDIALSTQPAAETSTVHPAQTNIARTILRPAADTATEDITEGPVNLAEISSEEFEAAAQWAQNEFSPIEQSIANDTKEENSRELSDELTGLSASELDRVYEMLKKMEQTEQEKIRKKQKDNKRLG